MDSFWMWMTLSIVCIIAASVVTVGLYYLLVRCFLHPRVDPTWHDPERTRGIDPAVIETFPTIKYSVEEGNKLLCRGDGMSVCVICVSVFKQDQILRVTPKCRHVFHSYCIQSWLKSRDTCPYCRASVVSQPGLVKIISARLERLV